MKVKYSTNLDTANHVMTPYMKNLLNTDKDDKILKAISQINKGLSDSLTITLKGKNYKISRSLK